MEKYGVDNIGKISGLVEKRKKTMIDRYGYDSPLKCPEIKQRVFDTNTKKYGHKVATLSPEIFEKVKKTNLERYGQEYATLVPEIREKMKETCMERYGHESALQNPQIQAKTRETLSKNGTMCSSSQQRYINSLYNGQLNYKLSKFFVDIYIEEESLCVEYDGGAHDLSVQTGKFTQEEFDKREMVREKIIKSEGNRLIRIISPTDKLPSDEILLQMLHEALEYFNATNHTWRKYYVELGIMKDAEHKNGAKYDYGTLWNAKALANQSKSA